MYPSNDAPQAPATSAAPIHSATDAAVEASPLAVAAIPAARPRPFGAYVGQRVSAPSGTIALLALFLTWVTVSQTSCGSTFSKGSWSGFDLLINQGWNFNGGALSFRSFGWGFQFIVPLVLAGVYGVVVGIRYWRDRPSWGNLQAFFICAVFGVLLCLQLGGLMSGNPGVVQPGFELETAGLVGTLIGAALLIKVYAPPPAQPGGAFTALGLISLIAACYPYLLFLSLVVAVVIIPSGSANAAWLSVLGAEIVALVTGHILLSRGRRRATDPTDLLLARYGLLVGYSTLISAAYLILALYLFYN